MIISILLTIVIFIPVLTVIAGKCNVYEHRDGNDYGNDCVCKYNFWLTMNLNDNSVFANYYNNSIKIFVLTGNNNCSEFIDGNVTFSKFYKSRS